MSISVSGPSERDPRATRPRVPRIGIVEDHRVVALGLIELLGAQEHEFTVARTVPELLETGIRFDAITLDLRLDDGSTVADNVAALRATGAPVLVLTAGESAQLIREAARTDVIGIVRKSSPDDELRQALRDAMAGTPIASVEWAAAIDGASDIADAGLTAREREILALYASGEKAYSVALLTGLTPATVNNHVSRIRAKYTAVGRDAPTKVHLLLRATEDGILDANG